LTERISKPDDVSGRIRELRGQLDHWSGQLDGLKKQKDEVDKALGDRNTESMKQKADLKKMKKEIGYGSEQEIDARIADIEFRLWTETVPLKQEHELLKEIQKLKRDRLKVPKVNQLQETIAGDDSGGSLREELKDVRHSTGQAFAEKQKVSQALKALIEERNRKMGNLRELIQQRDKISKEIQGQIKERSQINADKEKDEAAYDEYKQKIQKIKQKIAAEERLARQKELEKEKLKYPEEHPFVREIALVEQCISFCKSFTQEKTKSEEKKEVEVAYDLPDCSALLAKKDREEFYFEPTSRGKKGKSKPKKEESASKPIKHNAETFNLFGKLELDAPISSDDVPALVEKLEVKLAEYERNMRTEDSIGGTVSS